MSFNFVKKLPTPAEIREQYPVSDAIIQVKKERDEMIRKVFTGESDKFLVIIENVPFFFRSPVDVNLIRIEKQMRVVNIRSGLCPILC